MSEFGGLWKHQSNPPCTKSVRVFKMLKLDTVRKKRTRVYGNTSRFRSISLRSKYNYDYSLGVWETTGPFLTRILVPLPMWCYKPIAALKVSRHHIYRTVSTKQVFQHVCMFLCFLSVDVLLHRCCLNSNRICCSVFSILFLNILLPYLLDLSPASALQQASEAKKIICFLVSLIIFIFLFYALAREREREREREQ